MNKNVMKTTSMTIINIINLNTM